MYKVITIAAAAAVAILTIQGLTSAPPAPQPAPGKLECYNSIPRELLVVYDITGSTLTGPIHKHLAVYNDGTACISEAGGNTGSQTFATAPAPNDGRAEVASVSPAAIQQLMRELLQAGAFTACDESLNVSDVPLQTLTILTNSQNAWGHSFSFWGGDPYTEIVNILNKFIANAFPNF